MIEWFRSRRKRAPSAVGIGPTSQTQTSPPGASVDRPTAPEWPAHRLALRAGRTAEAEASASAALLADAGDYDAALTLACAAIARRRAPEARRALGVARTIDPLRGETDLHLARLHLQSGRQQEALDALLSAVRLDPGLAEAQLELSGILRARGQLDEALETGRAAVRADPSSGAAHNNLGGLLRDRGHNDAALPHFLQAVQLAPEVAEAWFNLGLTQFDLTQAEDSAESFRRSLAIAPRQADANYWLGNSLMAQGRAEDAVSAYREALKLDANFLRARWALTTAQIVPVAPSTQAEVESRQAFGSELDKLAIWLRTRNPRDAHEAVATTQPFYLAYQEADPRPLLERYGEICVRAMGVWQKTIQLATATSVNNRPLRVGIVSAHLQAHSVWFAILRGWIEHFDRRRIELHLFHLSSKSDRETEFARSRAARYHGGLGDWAATARLIADSHLDVVIYPEVGMNTLSTKLAALRLARCQVASWGHPVTTGLPTIDHFVSAAAFEPQDARAQYTERLHCLPGVGCCYRPFGTKPEPIDLAAHGIPPSTPVLLCPGLPFKYMPRFDRLWVEIARRATPCRLVFFKGGPAAASERLEQRLRGAFDAAGLDFDRHVRFVAWQSHASFFGWMTRADAFLDTPGFSGFNTAMQAIECAAPVVAWEGQSMRSRLASGILRTLGLDEWVAVDEAGYVDRAERLCRDVKTRETYRAALSDRRTALYNDASAAHAMQELILELSGDNTLS